jgi:hypothetical protein
MHPMLRKSDRPVETEPGSWRTSSAAQVESIHLGMLRHTRFADLPGQWIAIRCSVIVEKLGNTDWIRR